MFVQFHLGKMASVWRQQRIGSLEVDFRLWCGLLLGILFLTSFCSTLQILVSVALESSFQALSLRFLVSLASRPKE